jgi:hypothetical protein
VAGGLLWTGGGIGWGVEEGAPVVAERVEPVADLAQAGAHVGEGERGPVGRAEVGCGSDDDLGPALRSGLVKDKVFVNL